MRYMERDHHHQAQHISETFQTFFPVTAAASVSSSTVINGATTTTTTTTMSIPVLSPDVAFVKLEQKFNQAMERLATMATEKEQLEHLNVQLQEETETVGE